jgi:hypothetical protein
LGAQTLLSFTRGGALGLARATLLRLAVASTMGLALQGCSTFSFATPVIPMGGHAQYSSHLDSPECQASIIRDTSVVDRDDPRSAINLVDNYAGAYKCAMQSASNGRQYFQVPSQLAALVGVAGAALGGSTDLALISGASAATFNSGNDYWAPQEKASVLDSAYNAIECIRMAAVGLDPIEARDAPDASTDPDEVAIPVAWRYYDSIKSALGQVDRVAGSRLRETGKFDPDGLIAEIEKLNEEIEERKKAGTGEEIPVAGEPEKPDAEAPAETTEAEEEDDGGGTNVPATGNAAAPAAPAGPRLAKGVYLVKIPLLQSRLQLCVVKAKI